MRIPVEKPETLNRRASSPTGRRKIAARALEIVLSAKFLAPFGVIVVIFAVVVLYVTSEQGTAVRYRQAEKELSAGNFSRAETLFREFALENPDHPSAPKAREEAKYCAIMQQVLTAGPDREPLIRQCEAFLTEYEKSERAAKVRDVTQQTLYDQGDHIFQEALKARDAARMEKAIPTLERCLGVNPVSPFADQAKTLIETVRQGARRVREEDAFARARSALLKTSEGRLKDRKFAAVRAEIVRLTEIFPFAAQDKDLLSLEARINEQELQASSFAPAREGAPAPEAARAVPPEANTFLLIERRAESLPRGLEGEIVFLMAKGRCLALDAATGAYRWSIRAGAAASILPVTVREPSTGRPLGALIPSGRENLLRLVASSDGSPKWTYRSPAPFVAPPVVYESQIYLPTLTDGIHVLNAQTGALEGRFWFDGEIRNAPIVDEERGVLYVLPENGCIYAISLSENVCKQIVSEAFEPFLLPCQAVPVGSYLLLIEYQDLRKMRVRIFSRNAEGFGLRPIRTGKAVKPFDLGENVGCRPIVAAGSLYSVTESGTLKVFGVNVKSEDEPMFPAADHWPPTDIAGDYSLLLDTDASPFHKGIGSLNPVLVCGSGVVVFQFSAPDRKLTEVWRFPPGGGNEKFVPGQAFLPPQRVGNLVCVSTIAPDRDGICLTAIDLEQKAMAWQAVAGAAVTACAADETGKRVFVHSRGGSVYALAVGANDRPAVLEQRLFAAKTQASSVPDALYYAPPGRLYIGGDDNALHAVDTQTGGPAAGWEEPFRTQAPCGPMAPLGRETLVFGTAKGDVFLAALAGSGRYAQEFSDPARASYAVSPLAGPDGAVYIGNDRGVFQKLVVAEQSGQRFLKPEFKFRASAPIRAGAAAVNDTVFVGDMNGKLYALAAKSLKPVAEWSLDAPITSDLVTLGDAVCAASEAGCVYAVSLRQKTPLWRFPPSGFAAAVAGRPLRLGELVLIGTQDGKVYALQADTGRPVWTHEVGSGISGSLAVAGRWLVVPCSDGSVKLVALPDRVKGN